MNDISTHPETDTLKKYAAAVYLCQVLAFGFFGLPLLIGVVINFIKKNEAEGTWIASHFDWQIKSVWITLAGFAIGGIALGTGIGIFILMPVIVLFIYRIVIGWHALNAGKPMVDRGIF